MTEKKQETKMFVPPSMIEIPMSQLKLRPKKEIYQKLIEVDNLLEQFLNAEMGDAAVRYYPVKVMLEWVLNMRQLEEVQVPNQQHEDPPKDNHNKDKDLQ